MDMLNKMSDEQLVKLYASGTDQAFEVLLFRYKNLVYRHIYSYLQDSDISNDIFQETFIKVITCIRQDSYKETGKFGSWVVRISHNLVIDYMRSQKCNKLIPAESESYTLLNNAQFSEKNIEESLISNQTKKEIHLLIGYLPKNQRDIIFMRFFEDLSFKEIAERTGVSINTSLGRMRYALMNIRKIAKEKDVSLSL